MPCSHFPLKQNIYVSKEEQVWLWVFILPANLWQCIFFEVINRSENNVYKLHYRLLVQENGGFTLANEKAELGPFSFKVLGGVAFLAISISIVINPSLVKKNAELGRVQQQEVCHWERLVC